MHQSNKPCVLSQLFVRLVTVNRKNRSRFIITNKTSTDWICLLFSVKMSQNHPSRFTSEDIAAVRRGFATDHGRYMALMDLSHLLSSDNMEALLPAAEAVLNRPNPINPSMVDLPSTSRLDMDELTPPPPPLPLPKIMVKNLLKDRRRIALNFPPTTNLPPIFQEEVVKTVDKSLENFQLKKLFKSEANAMKKETDCTQFATDMIYNIFMEDMVNEDV